MRKTFFRNLCWLLAVLVFPLGLLLFAFGLPSQYEQTYLGELHVKQELLAKSSGRRIIMVGGSGVAFGQRSDLLQEALPGYSVINFGMYAGLGSTVTMELVLPLIRDGDIVIFSPEQSEQTLSMYLNAQAMWPAADGHWNLLSAVRHQEWGLMVGEFPGFAAQKAGFYFHGNAPTGEGVYSRSAFNAFGDIDCTGREQNRMVNGYDPNMMLSFDPALMTEEMLDYINASAAECKQRGASFFYGFCPMNASAITENERNRAGDFQDYLESRLTCPILGEIEETFLEEDWFYDTNFHLNSAGAVVNTARLADDLREALGLSGKYSIETPAIPTGGEQATLVGDNTDEAYFRYKESDDGFIIIGLTGEGRNQTHLTIPSQHRGRPVSGFSADTFSKNSKTEEIIIQANVSAIENASFAGCTALKRLVIRNWSPASCSVGEGLLDGVGCTVYVPEESLGSYVTNYFWSVHASRIQGEAMGMNLQITVEPVPEQDAEAVRSIRYFGNGGVTEDGNTNIAGNINQDQLRVNTMPHCFTRDGYALIGWNTKFDGSGEHIGLGSRVTWEAGLSLYAQWLPENPASEFTWKRHENQVWLTGYSGTGPQCIIPAYIDGLPVRRVCAGAFTGANPDILVLPPQIFTLEKGAFARCTVRELYLYDSIISVCNESFAECKELTTLHINAAVPPVYSASYYATFADKFDRLLSLDGEQKLVLFSGSSTRYGYDSAALEKAYPAYSPVNMGVYAYTNALPQMELIRRHMEGGDVLLCAPEFDTLHNQLCYENTIDKHFWAMMEANYDMAAELDLREYTGVFDSLGEYLKIRTKLPELSYAVSPNRYDDDGNWYPLDTYNAYGDFILLRPNEQKDVLLQHMRANYTTTRFTAERLDALNREYRRFLDDGIAVYFTYSPRNQSSLTPESTPEVRAELDALLHEKLCVPVISNIEDYLYPGIYFYLIDSHLSTEGVHLRTTQIIEDLRPWLNYSGDDTQERLPSDCGDSP